MSALLIPLLLFGILLGPQFYNIYYAKDDKLWKTLFLGLVYGNNLRRDRRKRYCKIYLAIWLFIIIVGVISSL
tara:strand:- start:313 stop:531 length:219 start_codon:yes stop_codon:yes gene_type:complete